MKISVIGCGRWGSFHAWYASKIGHSVTLYGRENSANMRRLETTGGNDYLTLPEEIKLTKNLFDAVNFADVIIKSTLEMPIFARLAACLPWKIRRP